MRYLYFCLLFLPFSLLAQTPVPLEARSSVSPVVKDAVVENLTEETPPTSAVTPRPSSDWLERKRPEQKIFDKKFYALMLGLQVSTIVDLESSYYTLNNCPRGYVCHESNPMLRPFVHSGRPAAYTFTAGTNVLAVWSSSYMRRKGHRLWWTPMALYIGVHTFAAAKNFHTAAK